MIYKVFTDGSSSKKRKTIGTSYVVFEDEKNKPIITFSKGFKDKWARNGIAELLGIYYFLFNFCSIENICFENNSKIIIYSDSQYVVNELTLWFQGQMVKNFFDIKNKEILIYILWMLWILKEEGYTIIFKWVKGHQQEKNFEALGNNLADYYACMSHDPNKSNQNFSDVEEIVKELKEKIEIENTLKTIKNKYLGI